MKPVAVATILSIFWLSACRKVRGQSLPVARQSIFVQALAPRYAPEPTCEQSERLWQPPPLPPSPDAFLWEGYRGAVAEHQFTLSRPRPVASFLKLCWDGLLAFFPHQPDCNAMGQCLRTPTAAMLGCQGDHITSDCGCYSPSLPLVHTPVPLPLGLAIDPLPLQPVPIDESDAAPPAPAPSSPPAVRAPVVVLAPDPVLPPDPMTAPLPRNRVPKPGETLPRNVVPR